MAATPRSIVDNLRRAADRHGHRVAIVHAGEEVTYGELWRRVTALAAYFQREAMAPGDRVGLVGENSAGWVVACYGALAAGGIVVPLNAAAKARDLGTWLRHSGSRWLVCESGNEEALDAARTVADLRLVFSDRRAVDGQAQISMAAIQESPGQDPAVGDSEPDAPASILYTSGTTGAPKGVLLSHENLRANTQAIVTYLRLGASDSVVSVLPFYYAYGQSILHTHVQAAARLVIEPNFLFPPAIVASMAAQRVSGFAGVPSTFALMLARTALSKYDLSALRYVTQAGGPMAPALVQRLRTALPHVQLFLMYGQTEATARLTYLPPEDLDRKPNSVGVPVAGVQIQIRSARGAPCAAGQVGDIWVRGPNVMCGYWRDPAATARVLRDGWLKTGDVGYLDDDGYLFVSGRRSDIIKTGAHRVHPQDVEEAILEMEGVAEVAIVGADDQVLGQSIRAFVVPAAGHTMDAMAIRAHCRDRLPLYKVPRHVELVDSLPKTSSGKVRRHELASRAIV